MTVHLDIFVYRNQLDALKGDQKLAVGFFFWGAIKNSVYSNTPQRFDVLKLATTEYIRNVDRYKRTQFGVSINVWRLAGDTLNITCNFLYCNHQVNRDFLITLYLSSLYSVTIPLHVSRLLITHHQEVTMLELIPFQQGLLTVN
jgi:hypothetical protein